MYIPEFLQSSYYGTGKYLDTVFESAIQHVQSIPSMKKLMLLYGSSITTTLKDTTPDFKTRCLSFQSLKFVPNAVVHIQQYYPAGSFVTDENHQDDCLTEAQQTVSADMCRIALNITTSPSSGISFEAWLPDNYTNRLYTVGTSGMGGCIRYVDLDFGITYGFATVASNNGHEGNRASVFYNASEVLEDFAWRALHITTEAGKSIVPEFYGAPFNKSYFSGCSGAGRQGIKAAEMWPEDYDGMLVGAPGVDFNNLQAWVLSFYDKTGDVSSPDFIDPNTWTGLIHNEIMAQCDLLDGVADGIIEDPNVCDFKPETLICEGPKTESCLTSAQVAIVRNVFSPLTGYDGSLVFPAMQPGSELMAVNKLYTGIPYDYAYDWFKFVVFSDPTYTLSNFTTSTIASATSTDPFNISTSPTTLPYLLPPYSGKILLWHGNQDQEITSYNTELFYNRLLTGMNLTYTSMDRYLRFFRISGVHHCRAGPGAWMIGAESEGIVSYDWENSVLAALVRWVEEGEGMAPDTVLGTKHVNDDVGQGVERRRSHCRYPFRNTYLGEGRDGNLAESWECRLPGQGPVVGS